MGGCSRCCSSLIISYNYYKVVGKSSGALQLHQLLVLPALGPRVRQLLLLGGLGPGNQGFLWLGVCLRPGAAVQLFLADESIFLCFRELGENGFEFGAAVAVFDDFFVVGDVAIEQLVIQFVLVFCLRLLLVDWMLELAVHDVGDDPFVPLPGRLRPVSLHLALLCLGLAYLHP